MQNSSTIESLAGSPPRILIVDDDPNILRLVRDKLDRAGFEILTASSGQHALEVIGRCGLPHLAIVDINMPGMDGFEFCQVVQAYSDLPVILCTGGDRIVTAVEAEQAGIREVVLKPFMMGDMARSVQRALADRQT